jgi:hypothetical protein
MPIDLEIIREGRIVVLNYGESFTMGELTQIVERMHREVFNISPKRVYSIVNFLKVTKMPPNVVGQALQKFRVPHPNEGETAVVLRNRFFVSMGTVYNKIARPIRKTYLFSTLDEAITFLDRLMATETD